MHTKRNLIICASIYMNSQMDVSRMKIRNITAVHLLYREFMEKIHINNKDQSWGMRMNRSMVLVLLIVVLAGSIWGCGRMRQKKEKEHGVEYTVLGEDQIPDEIRKVVDVKKQEEFQMTYQEEDMLYLLQGYGIQSSGGYSIRVEKSQRKMIRKLSCKRQKLIGPKGEKMEERRGYLVRIL